MSKYYCYIRAYGLKYKPCDFENVVDNGHSILLCLHGLKPSQFIVAECHNSFKSSMCSPVMANKFAVFR